MNTIEKYFNSFKNSQSLPQEKVAILVEKAKKISSIKKNLNSLDADEKNTKCLAYAAEKANLTTDEIKEILSWNFQEISLEGFTDEKRNPIDAFSYNHSEAITDRIVKEKVALLTKKALDSIPPRQKFIITRHYGLNCEKLSLSEIGKLMNITKQRAAQLEKDGIDALKKSEFSKYLYEYIEN